MKEDTGQSLREVTLPLVTFDPSEFSGSAFDKTRQSSRNFSSKCGADVNCSKTRKNGDKKCAKACSLPKKVSF